MKGLSNKLSKNITAVIIVLLCFLVYNIADAFLNGVVDHYHFGSVGFYPHITYLIFFLLFSKRLGGLKQIPKTKKLTLHLLRGFFSFIGFLGFIVAISEITLAQTYTLILASPIWVALISVLFMNKKIGINRWLCIIVGFVGVLIALQPDNDGINLFASLGALVCGISAGSIMLIARRIGEDEPMVNLIFYPMAFVLTCMIFLNTFWLGWEAVQTEHLIFFAIAGLFFILADISFSKGFSMGETTLLAPLHYSQIIWGALIGYFFFAEIPTQWTIIGAIIITLSGIYMIYRENKVEGS